MSGEDARRGARRQGGFGYIDTLIGVAILTVSIVFITGSFANAQRTASSSQDQAQLEVTMRRISDVVRSKALSYQFCATAAAYNTSIAALDPSIPAGSVKSISRAISADYKGGATETPFYDCSSGTPTLVLGACPAGAGQSCDWGVQRIVLGITSSTSGRLLTRVVFKGLD